jgi:hypothetical protein
VARVYQIMQIAALMTVLEAGVRLWIVLAVICGPPVMFGLYIAWLVVPTVVKTVIEEVVRAVNSEFNGRRRT